MSIWTHKETEPIINSFLLRVNFSCIYGIEFTVLPFFLDNGGLPYRWYYLILKPLFKNSAWRIPKRYRSCLNGLLLEICTSQSGSRIIIYSGFSFFSFCDLSFFQTGKQVGMGAHRILLSSSSLFVPN